MKLSTALLAAAEFINNTVLFPLVDYGLKLAENAMANSLRDTQKSNQQSPSQNESQENEKSSPEKTSSTSSTSDFSIEYADTQIRGYDGGITLQPATTASGVVQVDPFSLIYVNVNVPADPVSMAFKEEPKAPELPPPNPDDVYILDLKDE